MVMQNIAEIDAAADSIPSHSPSRQSFTVLSHKAATVKQHYQKWWNCTTNPQGKESEGRVIIQALKQIGLHRCK